MRIFSKCTDVQPTPRVGRGIRRAGMRRRAGIGGRPLLTAQTASFHPIWEPGGSTRVLYVLFADFLIEHAVKKEDKEALKRVEGRENVGHDHVFFVNEKQAGDPGEAKENDQNCGAFDPRRDADIAALMLLDSGFHGGGVMMIVGDAVFGDGRIPNASVFAHLRV